MLQELIIRRAFAGVDFILAILVIGAAGLVMFHVVEEAPNPFAEASVEADSFATVDSVLKDVGPRQTYDCILNNRLFGPAGDKDVKPKAPPPKPKPPPEPEVEETKLSLALRGTAATGDPTDPMASAQIENKNTRKLETYFLGDTILDGVLLVEVHQRKVLISNHGKNEVLSMEDEAGTNLAGRPPPPRSQSDSMVRRVSSSNNSERFELDKREFIKQLYVDYADIVSKVKPEMYVDENGNVAGVTASNIEDIPLAKTLDLHDGDVLQTINNEVIDSEDKIIRLVNKYRNSSMFRIGILRNGQKVTRTYSLK